MYYRDFKGKKLSALGFGTMRLPMRGGEIDETVFREMVRTAMDAGVNYFDTAWPYHEGKSEISLGRMLAEYPRESYYIADKYPGHQISERYDAAEVFEAQLKKCGVDFFDFYLLHNVYESSIDVYLDRRWGIIDYLKEQRRAGRIRHLGFSTHGGIPMLRRFLDEVGEDMEFCQIQLNYVDWTLQDAAEKVALLRERDIPIFVMEPLRGGKLCTLGSEAEERLRELRPEEGIPAWAFRFLESVEGVTVVLSGMSSLEQMRDNIKTFESPAPVSNKEREVLLEIAEELKGSVPCTACRYCVDSCPLGLDIPSLISIYNELTFVPTVNTAMRLDALPAEKRPEACLACGACAAMCPQRIAIPEVMSALSNKLAEIPRWADICREREEAARRLAGK